MDLPKFDFTFLSHLKNSLSFSFILYWFQVYGSHYVPLNISSMTLFLTLYDSRWPEDMSEVNRSCDNDGVPDVILFYIM